MAKRGYTLLAIALIITTIYQLFTLSYGRFTQIEYQAEQIVKSHKSYAAEHLSVVYERRIGKVTDFVHLQVDTTYRQIGKSGYQYKIVCDRDYSLREFDGEYRSMNDVVAASFISGADWQLHNAHRKIIDYSCQRATRLINGEHYEAWYTDALPHVRSGCRATDENRGLILEARSADGRYELRAKYIEQLIG